MRPRTCGQNLWGSLCAVVRVRVCSGEGPQRGCRTSRRVATEDDPTRVPAGCGAALGCRFGAGRKGGDRGQRPGGTPLGIPGRRPLTKRQPRRRRPLPRHHWPTSWNEVVSANQLTRKDGENLDESTDSLQIMGRPGPGLLRLSPLRPSRLPQSCSFDCNAHASSSAPCLGPSAACRRLPISSSCYCGLLRASSPRQYSPRADWASR
ncbi:hypothetical protein GGR56DRAFT_357146 [Xylariaceae sp. FL0804]|nr:hypothetical protein GGR56DRAFT_357146 [Xylariaceae sp. FL0804]